MFGGLYTHEPGRTLIQEYLVWVSLGFFENFGISMVGGL